MNPLEMSGPQFLELFAALFAFAFLVGLLLRYLLRQPGGDPGALPLNPDPYEIAMLSGPKAVVHAALARLLHDGSIRMHGARLESTGSRRPDAAFIERVVCRAVTDGEVKSSELLKRAEPAIQQLKPALIERGWLVDDAWGWRARWLPPLPCLAVLLLGLTKISVGLERDKPVAILVVFCCVATAGIGLLARRVWTSRQGDSVFQKLRWREQPLRTAARSAEAPEMLNGHDVGMAVALFGLGAMSTSDFELMRREVDPGSNSFGFGDSSSGGDGCGGGDGGGGGCGGCGGGD
ncbi:TIGR04222 domain-containing membrane protein [Myxococcus sp. CA056]|uniref:TIGR04222 domain-containing membrane protein n=1 Tax=Myxococcus sp. CA056 TaxID=2741740 RepID=UPI00157AC8F6|nr:TIGR04222 domain-containing membrane protein [Myxococcus sp. CA056]NTX13619.1 TIGR04222 domain-containing membrane protein [Myxococcus sp. CA056]